jgi:hypothetical protein
MKHEQNTIQGILCKSNSSNNITINSLIKIEVIVTKKKHTFTMIMLLLHSEKKIYM